MDIERKTEKYFSISGCHELAISVVINLPEASAYRHILYTKAHLSKTVLKYIFLTSRRASAEIIHPRW